MEIAHPFGIVRPKGQTRVHSFTFDSFSKIERAETCKFVAQRLSVLTLSQSKLVNCSFENERKSASFRKTSHSLHAKKMQPTGEHCGSVYRLIPKISPPVPTPLHPVWPSVNPPSDVRGRWVNAIDGCARASRPGHQQLHWWWLTVGGWDLWGWVVRLYIKPGIRSLTSMWGLTTGSR